MSLKAVDRPQSLGDSVYLSLRDHLCSGRIPRGHPLQEAGLAAQLGVSRTPVREALARLASDGLLEASGRSFAVPVLSVGDIDDIYEMRLMLEPEAIRQVATRRPGRAPMKQLSHGLATMAAAHAGGDAPAFMDANDRYRAIWLGLVPNRRLVRAIELHADHVRFLRALTLGERGVRAVVLRGLKHLSTALAAGDGEGAAAAMRAHLLEAKQSLHGALARSGEY